MHLAGRLLRGTGTYTSVLRAMGFAQAAISSGCVHVYSGAYYCYTIYFDPDRIHRHMDGVSTAHNLKGWRTLVLPVVYILVAISGFVIFFSVIGGLTWRSNHWVLTLGYCPLRNNQGLSALNW